MMSEVEQIIKDHLSEATENLCRAAAKGNQELISHWEGRVVALTLISYLTHRELSESVN